MKLQTVRYGCHIINGLTYCELHFVEHLIMVRLLLWAAGTLFLVAGGGSKDFAVSGGGMNQIIETAPRQRSRCLGALEYSGPDSEDRKADEAEWEHILATM